MERGRDIDAPVGLWVWGVDERGPIAPAPVAGHGSPVTALSCGFGHVLAVRGSRVVWAWGSRKYGRLGNRADDDEHEPQPGVRVEWPVAMTHRVVAVACGFGHSAAVSEDGRLWTWGHARDGALGHGEEDEPLLVPRAVAALPPIRGVSCGALHTVAVGRDGIAWACGSSTALGAAWAGRVMRAWPHGGSVLVATAGHKSALVVAAARPRSVWLHGDNKAGQLGVEACEAALDGVAVAVADAAPLERVVCGRHAAALDADGRLYCVWRASWEPFESNGSGIRALSASATALYWIEDGRAWSVVWARQTAGATLAECVTPVAGLPSTLVSLEAGYRTVVAVEQRRVRVTPHDLLGVERAACRACGAGVCASFAGRSELTLNSREDELLCVRCGCNHTEHVPVAAAVAVPAAVPWSVDDCKQALVRRMDRVSVVDARAPRVYAVSDIHTDFPGNMQWARDMVAAVGNQHRGDVLVVAGDISHDMGIIETTLRLLREAFGVVVHVCGNHELWVVPSTDTVRHAYHKMHAIMDVCDSIDGVYAHPVMFDRLAVVPLLTWYEPQFTGRAPRSAAMQGFDAACRWPESDSAVTTSLLAANAGALARVGEAHCEAVVTFSHFLPRPELYFGWRNMQDVMGSLRIDGALRSIESQVHVFGHSHMDVDRVIEGVRYVQHALGSEPHQRKLSSWPAYQPKLVWEDD